MIGDGVCSGREGGGLVTERDLSPNDFQTTDILTPEWSFFEQPTHGRRLFDCALAAPFQYRRQLAN